MDLRASPTSVTCLFLPELAELSRARRVPSRVSAHSHGGAWDCKFLPGLRSAGRYMEVEGTTDPFFLPTWENQPGNDPQLRPTALVCGHAIIQILVSSDLFNVAQVVSCFVSSSGSSSPSGSTHRDTYLRSRLCTCPRHPPTLCPRGWNIPI